MKFLVLSVFASLLLAAQGEAVRPMPKKYPYQFIRDWQKYMDAHAREVKDVTLDNIWNNAMPKIQANLRVSETEFKEDYVYQLSCDLLSGGTLPSAYNIHFLSGKDGKNSLGFYSVKAGAKATEFTANKDGLAATKHQVLEVEGAPNKPVTLLIKPKAADAFSCRVEVDDKKHPYNAFSADVNIGTPAADPPADPPTFQNPLLAKH